MSTNNGKGDQLRSAFVEMLFALAAAQVAIYAADLVALKPGLWASTPAAAHLTVGMILIAASWFGWSQSKSPGKLDTVESIFSYPFLGLLLDVLLVTLYFIVVRSVEIDQIGGVSRLSIPTAVPESFWISVVFGIYVGWDIVTDVLPADCIRATSFSAWPWKAARVLFVSTSTSLCCLVLSLCVCKAAIHATTTEQVLFLDIALLSVVLLFRVLKVIENFIAPFLRVTDCRAFETPRKIHGNERMWIIILIITFSICLLLGLTI